MKHKVIQTNKLNLFKKLAQPSESVLHHGEKNNSSNPFSYQENPSRQRAQRFQTLVSGSKQPWRSSTFLNKYIILQKRIRLVGSLSLILLLALTAFTLRPVSVSTDFAEATANPATTTLTVATSGNAAILDITPSSTSGTFSSSDNSGTSLAFNVSTNNITGYNLSISHGSSTTPAPLVNKDLSTSSTTVALESLSSGTSITESEFNNSTYVGRYGYKPSKLNSQSNSNYIPAPTTNSTTLNKTTRANTASDEYTIALGANIDYTKSAGTYTNTFILTAVANNVAYTIKYLDDTGDPSIGDSLPATESGPVASAASFELSSTTPTRTGYTFAGWCDGTVTHNATGNDTCSGTTYGAGSAYSFASPSSTSTNVANLYAMWNVKTYSLAITFAGSGVSSVQVRTDSGTGGTLMGTVNSNGGSVAGLTYGVSYYLYPTYSTGYTLSSWAKTDSATNAVLSSTTAANPTYKIGDGNGAVTITGKAQTYTITLAKTNATAIKIDGTSYTGSSATLTYGNHTISGTYASGYEFSSWSTSNSTNLAITGTSSASTTITVHGAATLTLNGKSSGPTVIIKNVSNMTKVSLNGTECTSTSGCTVSGLTSGIPYELKAYYTATSSRFTGWTVSGDGTVATAANAETTFTPNISSGTITITPSITTSCTAINSTRYIQSFSFTSSHCDSGSLKDQRDNQIYTVARLNGGWWMTRNLAIGCNGSGSTYSASRKAITLNSPYSNVSADFIMSSTAVPDFNSSNNSDTSGYDTAAMKCDATYGAWYNYKAATAGTIASYSNGKAATYSICPKGWTLPTHDQQSGIEDYSFAFSPVPGGIYKDGSLNYAEYGNWWSSTARSNIDRYNSYSTRGCSPYTHFSPRYEGNYVRCIRSS